MGEDLFQILNSEGVIVASSRKGTEEVWQSPDGRLFNVYHYKSGRDEITPTEVIPGYLTVRYDPPIKANYPLQEFARRGA